MKQEIILGLLQEATDKRYNHVRKAEILKALLGAVAERHPQNSDTFESDRVRIMSEALTTLYLATVDCDRPELLVSLFPAFAIMCGSRGEHDVVCNGVNWSLVK